MFTCMYTCITSRHITMFSYVDLYRYTQVWVGGCVCVSVSMHIHTCIWIWIQICTTRRLRNEAAPS
jgi:hypothetical protein